MTIIERLNDKKENFQNQYDSLTYSSVPKTTLGKKIEILNELINAYQSVSSPINLTETEKILNQQAGFEKQKKEILDGLKIQSCYERNNFQRDPLVLLLVGPPGVGKTTLARILAQALKKELFTIALGGVKDSSLLLGSKESSLGNELGQLTKALIETKTHNPLILLDEFDKVDFHKGDSAIYSCLNTVLDPVQNTEILDYHLDVKLDFSRITFVVTVNDQSKIPQPLLSRMSVIVRLPGYDFEQKKAIAQRFIQEFFAEKESLKDNFEITSQALEILINKTREKGVRQLKKALDSIFTHCLLQWEEETKEGKPKSKIIVNSDLVHEIIPHNFPEIDLEDNQENKNEKKELEKLRRELAALQGEKNNQTELKTIRFNSLLVLRQIRSHLSEKEYLDYEGRINTASSREEVEVVVKEFLLKIKQKNVFLKPSNKGGRENRSIQDELMKIKGQNKELEERLKPFSDEIKKLKGEIENLRSRENWGKILLVVVIIILIIWGVYGMLKLLNFFRKAKSVAKKKKKTKELLESWTNLKQNYWLFSKHENIVLHEL